jgi:hypothetical protein
MATLKEKARDQANNNASWLRNALRFDRYGDAISDTGSMLVHKLPGHDDSHDSVMDTAQHAMDRARSTVSSAFDQTADTLHNLAIPGRKKKRRGPSNLVLVGVIVALAAGGYFIYRWLNGGSQPMDYGIQESWPAEPSHGAVKEQKEDDAEASRDAEESAALLDGGAAGATVAP